MENLVPYELAVKLKEKGFKEKCIAYYWEKINEHTPSFVVEDNMPEDGLDLLDLLSNHNCSEWSPFIDAPTISQVLKWLREEKKIMVFPIFSKYTSRWYCSIVNTNHPLAIYNFPLSDSYEEAALVGIEYVIDNLI